MNYIKGKFKQIIFESSSGYRVGLFRVSETDSAEIPVNKSITYTGYFTNTNELDNYKLYGKYIYHDRYGYQFSTESFEKIVPEGKDAIIDFLSSPFVKGCGLATAKRIYDMFGDDTLNKIKENKNNLELVSSISNRRIELIYNSVCKYFDNDKIIIELKSLGFTVKETMTLINEFGNKIIKIIENNIYDLVDYVSFKKLDEIFLNNNSIDDSRRVKACIIETIKCLTFENGDIYLYKEEIVSGLSSMYGINIDISKYLQYLFNSGAIAIINDKIYLKKDYQDEVYIANSVKKLLSRKKENIDVSKFIKKLEKQFNIKYNSDQKKSIITSLTNNLSIITGGPGTGKTTIIKGIIKTYSMINKIDDEKVNDYVLLLAPTGKASKRMSEATGYGASTIHRFLKWDKDGNTFGVNEDNQEHYNLIIIDEASMVDNYLMASLFRGLRLGNSTVVLVGDEYQLPSVRPGLILNDLISTDIPHIRLEQIYRQSDKSYIPMVAKSIKEKDINIVINGDDFCFIECDNKDIKGVIIQLLDKMGSKGITNNKIQILAPMYRGENGIDNLNILLQNYFNPEDKLKSEIKIGPIIYRVGDKVINLVNDLDNNIFNGDTGFIHSIEKVGKSEIITIDYDKNYVEYKREELNNVTHSYAITIHKAQGSEFEYIIMPISLSYSRMLYNKLLYTGVSRARKSLIIVGSKEAYKNAILNEYSFSRKTSLKEQIMNNN